MAVPLATAAGQILGPNFQDPPVKCLIKDLIEHLHLYEAIAEHPQTGLYHRYTREWALSLSYLESEVSRRYREVISFCETENRGNGSGQSETALRNELKEKMTSLLEVLEMHSRGVHWAREMARSPTPTRLFADYFRALLKGFNGSARAPNGEDTSNYGKEGTPMPEEYQALCEDALNPIEWLLVNKMMDPFISFFCWPFRRLAKKAKGGGDNSVIADPKVVNFAVISGIARVVVCMLANMSLAAAIGALNGTDGSTTRIIVMSVIGLIFASFVSFLGQDSIPIYTLITSYFSAMVIFVGTTSEQKTCK